MKYLKLESLPEDTQIKIVSLNRAEVKNAFNPEMIAEITQVFKAFANDQQLKAVVLTGEGNVFCAGADLNWMKDMANFTYEQNIEDSARLWEMFESIGHCEVPVIGLVQGAAYGGALGLIACCDYVVAEENTHFCFSEVKLGLAPAVISSFILRKVSDSFVRPYMLSGEVFTTEKAIELGLVHGSAMTTAFEIAKKFSSNGKEAMKATKKLLNSLTGALSWEDQKALTTKVISERRMSLEGQERLKKFFTKAAKT